MENLTVVFVDTTCLWLYIEPSRCRHFDIHQMLLVCVAL